MLSAVVTAVTTSKPQEQPPPSQGKAGTISGRHVHLGKFSGKVADWDDWSWQFKNVVISQNPIVASWMTDAENAKDDVDEDVVPLDLIQHSTELYSLMCQ